MKKSIIILTVFFTMIFNSTAFAKTFEHRTNVRPHKIWTINFNKDIKDVYLNVRNSKGEDEPVFVDIEGNKAVITPFLDYYSDTFTLKITKAIAADGSCLPEQCDMKFTVKE